MSSGLVSLAVLLVAVFRQLFQTADWLISSQDRSYLLLQGQFQVSPGQKNLPNFGCDSSFVLSLKANSRDEFDT